MRARNMQVLTDQLKVANPGVVIYGIGDRAHQLSPSGHNEDDTPGSRPEQEDPDTKPEHRAIDVMIGPAFTVAEAWALVNALISIPANRARLLYVIFQRKIWRAKNGFREEHYSGSDPHTSHPHVSGDYHDDENTTPWILDATAGGVAPLRGEIEMFMLQAKGSQAVVVSTSVHQRGIDYPTFLTYRDTLKAPFVLVPTQDALNAAGGKVVTGELETVKLDQSTMDRIHAYITEHVGTPGEPAGMIDANTLRRLMEEPDVPLEEVAGKQSTGVHA